MLNGALLVAAARSGSTHIISALLGRGQHVTRCAEASCCSYTAVAHCVASGGRAAAGAAAVDATRVRALGVQRVYHGHQPARPSLRTSSAAASRTRLATGPSFTTASGSIFSMQHAVLQHVDVAAPVGQVSVSRPRKASDRPAVPATCGCTNTTECVVE